MTKTFWDLSNKQCASFLGRRERVDSKIGPKPKLVFVTHSHLTGFIAMTLNPFREAPGYLSMLCWLHASGAIFCDLIKLRLHDSSSDNVLKGGVTTSSSGPLTMFHLCKTHTVGHLNVGGCRPLWIVASQTNGRFVLKRAEAPGSRKPVFGSQFPVSRGEQRDGKDGG